ncbi:1-acyl-sn-glycerol-3-phosphate acyltransferase [Acidihalobacter ferrooxydans]|uniref:Phospholipid/glycerol acyltransferase domain-containing protein n=1 Tax=Acidihalobacter ferrooxydans TaxID=1765967 RepID=A0A1P8UKL7_9GAMM|nr:1-acyl-sn-glycerol-3-phosphate acyltransferase [Acidihalobacter ferrooxydans]APZ44388.1 hypothetical protein BW247_15895 [Acidihalobacter ferrooxydans]
MRDLLPAAPQTPLLLRDGRPAPDSKPAGEHGTTPAVRRRDVASPPPDNGPSTGLRYWGGALLGTLIVRSAQLALRIEVLGKEHLRHAHGALVVSNHRRDTDGPIVGGILLQPRGLRFQGQEPFYAAREDLFRPGFLGQYLQDYPKPLHVLRHTPIARALRAMQFRPLRRIPEYSLGELLEDFLLQFGDLPLEEVLQPAWVERFAAALRRPPTALRLSDALRAPPELRYQTQAFRRLRRHALRRIAPYQRQVIARQLRDLTEVLDLGQSLYLAPEGGISMDGHFHRPRQALHYLLNASRRTPPVLPLGISYDPLHPGRTRVIVRIGEPLCELAGLSRRETDLRTSQAIRRLWSINASHLAAHYALRRPAGPGSPKLARRLDLWFAAVTEWARARDLPLDPLLLDAQQRRKRARQCARWLQRHPHCRDRLLYLDRELAAVTEAEPGLPAPAPAPAHARALAPDPEFTRPPQESNGSE